MNKILITRTDMLGDVILSFPVISALRKKYPSAQIWFLAKNYTKDILEFNPKLNGIISIDDSNNKRKNFFTLVKEIRKKRFDTALILYPTFKVALVIFLAGIRIRIGSGYRWYSFFFNKRVYEHRKYCTKHEVEYNLGLLKSFDIDEKDVKFDIEIPKKEIDEINVLLKDKGVAKDDILVIIHPGSRGSALDWDPNNFPNLIDKILSKTKSKVVISGTKSEEIILYKIMDKCHKKPTKFERELTLIEFASLLKRGDLFISNSTGPIHLAVALGTEVIGIYPDIIPLNPERWGPYGRENSVIKPVIPEGIKKNKKNFIKYKLMNLITPDDIFKLVERKISNFDN